MPLTEQHSELVQRFLEYFNVGGPSGCDGYHLTRSPEGFAVGTVTIDDFEEFTEETASDFADYVLGLNDHKGR